MDMNKALAEVDILRAFIDFVNKQVGVYCDCLTSFEGNKVRIERQKARVQRPTGRRFEDGVPVIMWASLEDPTRPDVIHHRIIRADDFIAHNAEAGFNEQQVCWSIVTFLFAYWDENIRPQIAEVRGVQPNAIQINALGDLRTLRKCIVHNNGIVSAAEYRKLKVMGELCKSDEAFSPNHDQMHKLFVFIKQAIASIILEYSGHLPGAPKAEEIVGIAIQNVGGR